ncbi:DNA invertase Pin-like site-specific DNA recombinase [Chryseobacterium jejuense]|nr:DNA invertase Pin-like site-specific DNA recombinase [Chryseobacterium jejuense]
MCKVNLCEIGYARVSKFEQNLDLQTDVLKNLGIEKKFID